MKRPPVAKAICLRTWVALIFLMIATVALSQEARVLSAQQGPVFVQQSGHELNISAGAFSPDGRYLLTGSVDGSAVLWELAKGLQVRRFVGLESITAVAFSPDGRTVAIASDKVRLFDLTTGQPLATQDSVKSPTVLQFAPSGLYLFVGGDGAALLRTGTYTVLWSRGDNVKAAAFSARGGLLVSGDEGISLLETASGEPLRIIRVKTAVKSIGLSADGRKLVLSGSPAVLLDVQTGSPIRKFESAGSVDYVALSSDGSSALLAGDRIARWDTSEDSAEPEWSSDRGTAHAYVLFSPDGRNALVADSANVKVLNLESGEQLQSFNGRSDIVWSVAATHDGRYIATGGDTARVWDTATGQEIKRLGNELEWAHLVAFSPNGQYLLTAGTRAHLWTLKSFEELHQYINAPGDVRAISFSGDSKLVALAMRETAKGGPEQNSQLPFSAEIFNVESAQLVKSLGNSSKAITAIGLSKEGEWLATGGEDETVRLWNMQSPAEPHLLSGAKGWIHAVQFSPDDKYIAAAAHDVYIWDRVSGALIQTLKHSDEVFSVSFDTDGILVVTGSADNQAHIWDWRNAKEVASLNGHSSYVVGTTFAMDAKGSEIVLTASADNTAGLWSRDGELLCRISSLPNQTWTVIDPRGRFDTNDPDQAGGLQWLDPKDPTRTRAVQAFATEFFSPGLLSRTLNGQAVQPTRAIESLNTAQPDVLIVSAEQKVPGGPITVLVDVSDTIRKDSVGQVLHSGVYGIRLLRDGRLVSSNPVVADADPGVTPSRNSTEDLNIWRQKNAVALDNSGRARLSFLVDVPRSGEVNQTELSAYAFNSDRVQSPTSSIVVKLASGNTKTKGRAYLVNIGISEYQDPQLNLRFSAADAISLSSALKERLASSGAYDSVVSIVLTSQNATKANISRVLGLLVGSSVQTAEDERQFGTIPRAGSQDLVLISFSGHAETNSDGSLQIYPYEARRGVNELDSSVISGAELASWIQEINASDITIVLDACGTGSLKQSFPSQSQAIRSQSIADSSLTRLAYDKRLRILAASLPSNLAIESDAYKHGLLTYALLEQLRTTETPEGQPLDIGQLLKSTVDRVPLLSNGLERPVLYDFSIVR